MEIRNQKVINAIKYFITSIIFINNFCGFSQKTIEGKYIMMDETGDYTTISIFEKNGIFKNISTNHTSISSYGKGHYYVNKDSLILNYDLTELKEESYFIAKKYYNSNDSITISLNIYDFDKKPVDNVAVYSFPEYKTTYSNKDGIASLSFKKEKTKEKIELYLQ